MEAFVETITKRWSGTVVRWSRGLEKSHVPDHIFDFSKSQQYTVDLLQWQRDLEKALKGHGRALAAFFMWTAKKRNSCYPGSLCTLWYPWRDEIGSIGLGLSTSVLSERTNPNRTWTVPPASQVEHSFDCGQKWITGFDSLEVPERFCTKSTDLTFEYWY